MFILRQIVSSAKDIWLSYDVIFVTADLVDGTYVQCGSVGQRTSWAVNGITAQQLENLG